MNPPRAGLVERVRRLLDGEPGEEAGPLTALVERLSRFALAVAHGFVEHRLLLHAGSLTYFTALSLLPLLAVALAIVKALGVSEDLAGFIVGKLAAGSPEAAERILAMVRAVDFARLGSLGAIALFVTTVLGLGNVEAALNRIWGIERKRSWLRRFADYLVVLIVAPLLLGAALSLGATLRSQALVQWIVDAVPGFSLLYDAGLRQAPTALAAGGFAFLYWMLPNTQVRATSALLGGIAAGLLFALAQALYVGLSVGVARSNALYGGFAALPLLLVWIYLSWTITLLGAEIAALHQRRAGRSWAWREPPGAAEREALGLAVALEVARAFREQGEACSVQTLALGLDAPLDGVAGAAAALERAGILAPRGGAGDGARWQLARPAEQVRLADVLAALRGDRRRWRPTLAAGERARRTLGALEREQAAGRAGITLEEILADGVASVDPAEDGH